MTDFTIKLQLSRAFKANLLITLHEIIIEENHEIFRDVWMLSGPKTDDMWYNKLSKSKKDDNSLENLSMAADGKEIDAVSKCLVMRKYSKLNPKFAFAAQSCGEKHSAICRLDPQMVSPVTEAPKFPCLEASGNYRTKRDAEDNKENDKGVLLIDDLYFARRYVT